MHNNVGAGLPAMQTPRFFSKTQVMLSQASQLPPFDLLHIEERVTASLTA